MADFKIDASALKRLDKSLSKAGVDYKKGVKRFLKELGETIRARAEKYSPRSMTKKEYESTLQDYTTMRDNTSFTVGSLEKSITADVGKDYVSINVPANSRGGKYAEKIHDQRGKSWHNLGIGSQKKGRKVGEKYIYRAAEDSKKNIDDMIDKTIKHFTKGIGV